MRNQVSTFRAAGVQDVDAVVQLVESAYRGEPSRQGWTTEADLLGGQRTDAEEVRGLLDDPDSEIRLACAAEGLVGCVCVQRDPPRVAHVGLFAVRPALQGRGVGKALLADAERLAFRRWAAELARMSVIEQRHELIAWYGRLGYHPTGRTEPFPYGNPRFGLPRRPDLRFVVLEKRLQQAASGRAAFERKLDQK